MVKKVSLILPVLLLVMALLPAGALAQTATPTATPSPSSEIKVEGLVESLQGNVLVIGGQSIDVSNALIESGVAVGAFAEAYVTPTTTGSWVARQVELHRDDEDTNEVEIKGIATEVGANFVIIGGRRFDTTGADIRANVVTGDFVELELRLSNTGQWVSIELKLDDDGDRGNDQDDDFDDDRNDDHGGDRSHDDADDNSGPGSSGDDGGGDNSGSGGGDDDDHDDDHGDDDQNDDHGGDDGDDD